jgi:hypothetical protein
VHAAFEDWLFAPGYYLCVFFWALAFIMVDVLPAITSSPASAPQNARRDGRTALAPLRPVDDVARP